MTSLAEVKLLTLLNVSAIKRPRALDQPGGFRSPSMSREQSTSGDDQQAPKRRRSVVFGGEVGPSGSAYKAGEKRKGGMKKGKEVAIVEEANGNGQAVESGAEADNEETAGEDGADSDDEADADTFTSHFGAAPAVLSPEAVAADEAGSWTTHRSSLKGLGRVIEQRPGDAPAVEGKVRIVPSVAKAFASSSATLAPTFLSHLGTYEDLYAHSLDGEADGSERAAFAPTSAREGLRAASSAHALNHVLKTRRRIVRNNERLARAAALGEGGDVESPRDQAFTRPKVLLLLPTRALALHWLTRHVFPLAGEGVQIENRAPFTKSFGLPEGVEDPVADKAEYPVDHRESFSGNTDDNFRFGIKITRKAWRVVMPPANEEKLLDCDIIVSSPLAIKMAAEREKSTDILSCIEILIVDGVDILQMQNWDHVLYVFSNLNAIPQSPHGCDFSRVKPWYLDGNASKLRQTLMFGRYDTPEARALLHRQCHNVAGKRRIDAVSAGALEGVLGRVREGVRQTFERIDVDASSMGAEAAVEAVDTRFEWFTKKTIPALLRSAVSRQNTLIVIPSYFDFVRVTNHLRKADTVSYAAISEYSSNSEIARARTLFFKGKKSFLIVTERFHFYRRYRLRGAKTVVFYQPPAHAAFYAELLATPFIASRGAGTEVDESVDPAEISARTLFSRFDVLALERIVGTQDARRMLASTEGKFEYE